MAATVGDLIDETYREWLEPPDDQALQAVLVGSLSAAATTLTYLDTYLSPEERYLFAPGSLIEIGAELIRIGDADDASNTLSNLRRGVDGTTAATHADGVVIKLHPRFPRKTVFNLVANAIQALWPPLYDVGVEELTTAPLAELPASLIQPISCLVYNGAEWDYTSVRVLNPFPASSTGKAAYFPDAATGCSAVLTYRKSPEAPTSESQFLTDLGVNPAWHRLIKIDVVLEAASNADLDRLTPEFTASRPELELAPIMAASEIRQRLIQYREYLVERAKMQLDHEYGATLRSTVNRTFY